MAYFQGPSPLQGGRDPELTREKSYSSAWSSMGWHMYFSQKISPKKGEIPFEKIIYFLGFQPLRFRGVVLVMFLSRWWVSFFLMFIIHLGKWSNLNIFQMRLKPPTTSRFLRKFGIDNRDWGWFQMIRGFLIHHGYYRYDANDCARKTYSNISHQTGKRNITSSFHPPFILSSPALSFFFFFSGVVLGLVRKTNYRKSSMLKIRPMCRWRCQFLQVFSPWAFLNWPCNLKGSLSPPKWWWCLLGEIRSPQKMPWIYIALAWTCYCWCFTFYH